jgi:NAD(P)-dependent dehydrogenase (short-subunit alcohol dehydrogenase family)
VGWADIPEACFTGLATVPNPTTTFMTVAGHSTTRPESRRRHAWRNRYGPWALLTGASDGIGKAAATRLASAGVNLVLVARREQRLRDLARELHACNGIQTRVIAGDLADRAFLHNIEAATQSLDVGLVVLAAGYGITGDFATADPATDTDMIAVNIIAVTRLAHLFAQRAGCAGSRRDRVVRLPTRRAGSSRPRHLRRKQVLHSKLGRSTASGTEAAGR